MDRDRAFWAIYVSIGISYLGVGLVAPLIAIVLAENGADSFLVGLVGTTMFAAFALSSFPVGALTDRFGPKPILVAGLVLYGLSILAFAFIDSVGLFFAVRAIEGIGAAAISVATETMISQLSSADDRARRMSYYALSVGLGWAAGPLAGGLLFSFNHALPFIAGSAFSLAAAAMAALLIPVTAADHHHSERITSVFSRRLIVPVAAGGLYGYLMSSLVTLFPLYLQSAGVDEARMGMIITAVIVGTIVSQVPIGRAADRFGKRRTLLICAVLLGAAFAALPSFAGWRAFIVTGALAGALAGCLYPLGLSIIGGLVPPARLGAANSLFSLAFGAGSLIGPTTSGLAMKHAGNEWLFYLPAALAGVFCLLMLALYRMTVPVGGTEPV